MTIQNKYKEILSELNENNNSDLSIRDKYIYIKRILERSCKEITKIESLQFSSLFSRLVFISQKYSLPRSLEWNLQNIRVTGSLLLQNKDQDITISLYESAYKIVTHFISIFANEKSKTDEDQNVVVPAFMDEHLLIEKDKNYLRVQIINIDKKNKLLICKSDQIQQATINVKYDVKGMNEAFNPSIENFWLGAQLNLLDFTIDKLDYYYPQIMVLEPDYLIDTSAMAECFQNYGKSHLHYFRRKFEQITNNQHILLGNLANFFLDELVYSPQNESLDFSTVFLESFRQKPFEYTSCNDIKKVDDFKTFMVKARSQFNNIKRVINDDFHINQIDINQCTLEPSFFCEKYGFQGRLDLLQLSNDVNKDPHKIVELKSGSLPYPKSDAGKIAINHEVQTTIYRLIIQSILGVGDRGISASILYSAADNRGENLRLAATFRTLEKDIINIRNLIVATEHNLYTGNNCDVEKLFEDICNIENYGNVPDFFARRISDFEKTIKNTTDLEKNYFFRYITFISRELYIQKIGDDNIESSNATASLWNKEYVERLEAFNLIPDLEIEEINVSERDLKILFKRNNSSDFVNFREGEICILHPHDNFKDTVLTHQIHKGTVAKISPSHILLRFRYKQKNLSFFRKYKYWVVEHDQLDHAYNSMYKSLYTFLQSNVDKRSLILGKKKPQSAVSNNVIANQNFANDTINNKRELVINKAIAATDYFLIVGPPGTGKTSVFARQLIEYYYYYTNENILIIAYTNRAVDELCESINQAFNCHSYECDQYVRIGTELSCSENYRHRLLQNISLTVKNREELRNILHNQRIYIGTLASIIGKPEIFDIKKFNLSIIDEASQILEPQIVGLLTKVDKFIMIGDHKQLSTITLQDSKKSSVNQKELNIIELYNCNESLFERLFRICKKNAWDHAYDTLMYQGRMHNELASFPNKYFYDNILLPIDKWQNSHLAWKNCDETNFYQQLIIKNRKIFINSSTDDKKSLSDKVNYKEAEIAVALSMSLYEIYKNNGVVFDSQKSLGIITPYRNQIALIKHKLFETGIKIFQDIMVDTVERFQGSQRDIIILSFCINKSYQLDFFSNMNLDKTVDRKLNVALTRARQQLFLIGNKNILEQNPLYKSLIDFLPQTNI